MGCGHVRPMNLERVYGSRVLRRQHEVTKRKKRVERKPSGLVKHHPGTIKALHSIDAIGADWEIERRTVGEG